MVTDDTYDTTLGKLSRRGYIGDFATSASPSAAYHLTCPAHRLVKNWGLCGVPITPNLVQRQQGEDKVD